jgi:hypothetical protein
VRGSLSTFPRSPLIPAGRVTGPLDHPVGLAGELVDGRAVRGREMEIEYVDIRRGVLAPAGFGIAETLS